ncbi:MAG: sigma-E factor negative regulatory protein [Panacagrimonas sp.]
MSKDALSALIDGECSGPELDRLLDEMDHAPELARQWSRMVLSREARVGTQVNRKQPCICADVMGRLEVESEHPKVVDLAARRASVKPPSRLIAFWKPAAGFAAAASMGAAAVLLVQPQSGPEEDFAPSSFAARDSRPVPGIGSIGGLRQVALDSDEQLRDQQYRRLLREYMMDHSHSIAGEGMGSTMGFTRIVAHTADDPRQNDEGR